MQVLQLVNERQITLYFNVSSVSLGKMILLQDPGV